MSQDDFAALIGVSRQMLSRWERGLAPIAMRHLIRIGEVVKRPLAYFVVQEWEGKLRWAPHIADVAAQLSVGAVAWYQYGSASGRWKMGEATAFKIMPLELIDSATVAITIRGSELETIGINDGDLLLVRMQAKGKDGDIVLMQEDEEVWIERKGDNGPRPRGVSVIGRVVKIVRAV